MHRRQFSQTLIGLGGLAATGGALPLAAQTRPAPPASAFREGTHYRRLRQPAPVDAPAGRIEVLEFFAYTCIHCHNFVPIFSAWKRTLPADVVVRHVPVGFTPEFEPLQRLFYTLEAMGRLGSHHELAFKAIHGNPRQRLHNAETIAQWAAASGLDRALFTQTYNSFAVVSRVRRATQLQDAYQVEGTPALGIAGRFYIPGQAERTLQVANALIERVRRGG